jgi:hypothetical protein
MLLPLPPLLDGLRSPAPTAPHEATISTSHQSAALYRSRGLASLLPTGSTRVFLSQATSDCQFVPMLLVVDCLTSGLPRVLLPNCSRVARWPHRCTYPCRYSCNSMLLWYRGGPTKTFSVSTLRGPARSAAAPFCFRLFRTRLTKRKGGSRNDPVPTSDSSSTHEASRFLEHVRTVH